MIRMLEMYYYHWMCEEIPISIDKEVKKTYHTSDGEIVAAAGDSNPCS